MSKKYIFITGGVVSSLGKGVASAALGALLQSAGYKVRLRKLDPYLNIDPGTMSPYQHGEVFVTDDGAETDLDLGHYERFTGVSATKYDSITAGKIYFDLLTRERKGEYLGGTVQVIPHVTDLIKKFIFSHTDNADFILCEIGGTVGDIEAQPFLEAIRQVGYELGKDRVMFLHLTLLPYIKTSKELKTKPSQHSVKELRSIGIQPDVLLCRSEKEFSDSDRDKIALFCNIPAEKVILGLDQSTIYNAMLDYHARGLAKQTLKHFNIRFNKNSFKLDKWLDIVYKLENPIKEVRIAVVGKYMQLKDSYKSLIEALTHAGIHHQHKVKIVWINAGKIKAENVNEILKDVHGILVPGGFGDRDVTGKILAIKYAREQKVPFFGICLGMQLATIEFARNVMKIEDANSTEFSKKCTKIIAMMTEWEKDGVKQKRKVSSDMGGTMRLGAFECDIEPDTLAHQVYNADKISERHRHRYEFNIYWKEQFEKAGLVFSGMSPNGKLTEIVEIKNHPWFIGVQFHPELKSKAFAAHPLFTSFVKQCIMFIK